MKYITDTVYTLQPIPMLKPIPENFYEYIQIVAKNGFPIKLGRFWRGGEELILCTNKETGVTGYYSTVEDKFYTVEEVLSGMGKDYDWESLMKQYYDSQKKNSYYDDVPYVKIDYIYGN